MAKVRLKRLAIEEGNSYHAGVYEANYLPPSILNDPDLIENLEGKITTPNFNNALKTEEITIGTDKPNSQEITFKGEPAKIIDSGSQEKNPPTQADEATPLNINKATVDDLAAIDGVTLVNAQKAIEERGKTKFKDFADLDKRVSLRGNRKWESMQDKITIE